MDDVQRAELERGWALWGAQQYERAHQIALRVLAREPDDVYALQLSMASLHHLDRYDESLQMGGRLAAVSEPDWFWWEYQARNQIYGGDPNEGWKACNELIALRPEYAIGHHLRSMISPAEGDRWTRPLEDIGRALELEPDSTTFQLRRGRLLEQSGDLAGARETYERVLAQEPDNADAMRRLADLLAERGSTESLGAYVGAARTDPHRQGDHAREKLDTIFSDILKAFSYSFPWVIFLFIWPFRIGMGGLWGQVIAGTITALSVIPLVRWGRAIVRDVPRSIMGSFARRHPLLVSWSAAMALVWLFTVWMVVVPGDSQESGLLPFTASLLTVMAWVVLACGWGLWRLGRRAWESVRAR